ncbi:MAG: MBL fold metallo-hydrolase [Phycisphaerae bacterium]
MREQLADGVEWVGVVDWGLRHFHGHELSTHRGSTYNAYLVRDEKTALVDTVWDPFADEFLAGLRDAVDLAEIDYIIVNHAEPDHSGTLPAVVRACPNATVVCSKKGAESIPGHYHGDWELETVGTGDRIRLGERELVFIEAPMLHWPDTMFTYLAPDGILMPNDAFGQHYATAYRFNDQVDRDELWQEALKYYVNILTPFSALVSKKIDEWLGLELPVEMIAPSHGVLWRDEPLQIVEAYREWAAQKGEARAVVLYDTMWQATRRMAEAVGEGLGGAGVPYKLLHLAVTDRNDALVELFRSRGIVIGSPTLNNGLLPSVMPILEDCRGLKFRNKVGAAFGSYGWSGEGVDLIEKHFETCKIPLAAEGVLAKWQPTDEDLERCRDLGRAVAAKVKEAG